MKRSFEETIINRKLLIFPDGVIVSEYNGDGYFWNNHKLKGTYDLYDWVKDEIFPIKSIKEIDTARVDFDMGDFCHALNLTNLRVVSPQKQFSVPKEIGNLKFLATLNLAKCGLKKLPLELSGCESLQNLKLRGNKLTSLPDCFGELSKLHTIDLKCNPFSEFPEELLKSSSLRRISFCRCSIRELPEGLIKMPSLKLLSMREVYDDEPIPVLHVPDVYADIPDGIVLRLKNYEVSFLGFNFLAMNFREIISESRSKGRLGIVEDSQPTQCKKGDELICNARMGD